MKKYLLAAAAATSFAFAVPASATIIIVDASSIQGDNVLLDDEDQSGTMIQGSTQNGTVVNFTGTTVGGGTTIRSSSQGQARVEGALDLSTDAKNDTLLLSSLDFSLDGGVTFNDLELNLFSGGQGSGSVTFFITDNGAQVFDFTRTLTNGENFFGFQGIDGQTISSVRFTTTAGIQDVRQVRLTEASMSAVPEPPTWAFMIVGLGAVGYSMRRRRTGYRTAQAV